ncbi:MAG: hypothetical protein AAGA35_01850 [Patescibacteria group bacterium]
MLDRIKSTIERKLEQEDGSDAVDVLISEFPNELQEMLWGEVEDFSDKDAVDYLTEKLILRKRALLPSEWTEIPDTMEVITNNPEAIQESLDRAHEQGADFFLGKGENGEVIASTRQKDICYKSLFLERAKKIGANISREALLQHQCGKLLEDSNTGLLCPSVEGFVNTHEVLAIKMQRLYGCSISDIIYERNNATWPEGVDIDVFFEKLKAGIIFLNEHGYHHRDISGNTGNVYVGEDGTPYLIDFGSAIKSFATDDPDFYQITPEGDYYKSTDIGGVNLIKQKLIDYLENK